MANGIGTAKTIDVHAHAVLAETMGAAGKFGPELGADGEGRPWFRVGDYVLHGVRYVGSPFMDVDLRIKRMDDAGIDFQILSPNPLTYFHFIEPASAIAFCRRHNDALAATVARYPDRIAGTAALPMQAPEAACEELHRAIKELGLLAPYIGTDMPDPLHSPKYDRLYETCVALDVPLFVHPAPAGLDGPPGDPNLNRFDLNLMIGFAAQETIAVATMIFGGVLERHPKLDVCVSHGGGVIGFLAGRLAQASRKRPWAPESLRRDGAFEAMLSRLWFDTHVNDERSLALLKQVANPERLVFGTNFAGWDQPDSAHHAPVDPVLAHNARRLLRRNA